MRRAPGWIALAGALLTPGLGGATAPVRVGSKQFTEGVLLGEIATQAIAAAGLPAEHRRQLGGTRILWTALVAGEVDVYPEYTGTLFAEIFAPDQLAGDEALARALAARGVAMTLPLGFNNTYAIGMREETAARLGVTRISDLAAHPEVRLALSSEFLDRADGWPSLRARYRLPHRDVRGLDHELALRALLQGDIDATDLYSTDADIRAGGLRVLADDLGHFPAYRAVFLYRLDLARRAPAAAAALDRLAGRIDEAAMIEMNARAKLERVPETRIAAEFLDRELRVAARAGTETAWRRLRLRGGEHLLMVGTALVLGIAVAVPLGILAARRRRLGQVLLAAVGVLQTVPSLAFLVLLIPVLGIGGKPAIVAVFVYGLLPILRNTHAGLTSIPKPLAESAEALGLGPRARLWRVDLPLALPAILAGIKTSAVLSVGTATLGALVGAGGFGQPILTGIRLADAGLVLEGAVPSALLALALQAAFELVDPLLVSPGLRRRREG